MRPVIRDKLRYESLLNGAVDLVDIALLNDALDCADENDARAQEAMKRGR